MENSGERRGLVQLRRSPRKFSAARRRRAARLTPSLRLLGEPDVFRTFRVYIQWGWFAAAPDFTRQWDYRKADTAVGAGRTPGHSSICQSRAFRLPQPHAKRFPPGG